MNIYLKALRAPFLAGSLVPVIIGAAFALSSKTFSLWMLLLCAVGIAGLHSGANLLNDYFDSKGSDPINMRVTPFSGGSRAIQDGGLAPRMALFMALFFFAIGVPQGFFITGVIWINQFPDYEADRKANKRNLVVRLGPGYSRYLYCVIMSMAFVIVFFLIGVVGFSYLIILSFMAFPLALKAMRILWREYLSHEGTVPAQALTIQTLIAHGLLLSIGIALSRFI